MHSLQKLLPACKCSIFSPSYDAAILMDTSNCTHLWVADYRNSAGEKLDMEAERRLRSADEMSAEATQLRQAMAELMQ